MESNLLKITLELAKKYNRSSVSNSFIDELMERLKRYDLYRNENVPEWIFILLNSVLNHKETGVVNFEFKHYGKGDWLNFFGQLHEYIDLIQNDAGESIQLIFGNEISIVLDYESDSYEVKKIE